MRNGSGGAVSSRNPSHYWETSAFVAIITREVGRFEDCVRLLEDAEAGRVLAVTSAMRLVEVTGGTSSRSQARPIIRDFFDNEYIRLVEVDRLLAESARELVWLHQLNAVDAVHVAAAIRASCDVLFTFDRHLLKLNGSISPRVEEPRWTGQKSLFEAAPD